MPEADEGQPSGETPLTYVNEVLPLYHRDWREIFTGFGLEEAESTEMDRDTMRVFRVAESAAD